MKKYNVKIQLLTGNCFENGEKEVAREIEVHTNNMNYATKKMFDNFNQIDINSNKVRIIDIKHDAIYNILIGERSTGKSHAVKEWRKQQKDEERKVD